MSEQFYPCLIDVETGKLTRQVGPAMSWTEAVDYLKQHYSGAWQNSRARAVRVSEFSSHKIAS